MNKVLLSIRTLAFYLPALILAFALVFAGLSNPVPVSDTAIDGCSDACPEHDKKDDTNCDDCTYCNHAKHMNYTEFHDYTRSDLEPSKANTEPCSSYEKILEVSIDHPPKV
jgi:hypothetical protein